MEDFDPKELEDALRRAFVERKADFIRVDSRRQIFRMASVDLGVARGWLTTEGLKEHHEEQYSWIDYRLTDAGRKHFGLT